MFFIQVYLKLSIDILFCCLTTLQVNVHMEKQCHTYAKLDNFPLMDLGDTRMRPKSVLAKVC